MPGETQVAYTATAILQGLHSTQLFVKPYYNLFTDRNTTGDLKSLVLAQQFTTACLTAMKQVKGATWWTSMEITESGPGEPIKSSSFKHKLPGVYNHLGTFKIIREGYQRLWFEGPQSTIKIQAAEELKIIRRAIKSFVRSATFPINYRGLVGIAGYPTYDMLKSLGLLSNGIGNKGPVLPQGTVSNFGGGTGSTGGGGSMAPFNPLEAAYYISGIDQMKVKATMVANVVAHNLSISLKGAKMKGSVKRAGANFGEPLIAEFYVG